MSGPSIALVSVHYYPDYQRRNLREIERLKRVVWIDRHVGVLNGGSELIEGIAGSNTQWVRHDNEGQEFGAYQRGLDVLLEGNRPDWVIFMNDTLGTHTRLPNGVLRRLEWAIKASDGVFPNVIGIVDNQFQSVQIRGHRGSRHVRSHALALNQQAIKALDDRIRVPQIDSLVAGGCTSQTFFSVDCDPNVQLRLLSFLFEPGPYKWYRATPLTADNCAAMSRKARAILQEYYLSFRLESVSSIFIDLRASTLPNKVRDAIETQWFFTTSRGSIREAR